MLADSSGYFFRSDHFKAAGSGFCMKMSSLHGSFSFVRVVSCVDRQWFCSAAMRWCHCKTMSVSDAVMSQSSGPHSAVHLWNNLLSVTEGDRGRTKSLVEFKLKTALFKTNIFEIVQHQQLYKSHFVFCYGRHFESKVRLSFKIKTFFQHQNQRGLDGYSP